jgi:hypothetical protein
MVVMMKKDWLKDLMYRLGLEGDLKKEGQPSLAADPEIVKRMVRAIVTTRPDEIDCDECFEQVDRFAEMVLDGRDAAEVMPLVQDHLERCSECREEFEALLAALRAMAEPENA